jgi:hypothetical protein
MREMNEEELKELLENVYLIDEGRLEDDLKEISYKYAELGVMLAKARAEYESKKLQFQILEANLAKHFRETLPKVTEKAVEEAIIRTLEWQEAKKQLIEAKQEVDLLSTLVQALEAKRDVLITYLSWKKELVRMNKEVEF